MPIHATGFAREVNMARWKIGATPFDRQIAKDAAHHAAPVLEKPLRALTWAADERLLWTLSATLWAATRAGRAPQRQAANHLIACLAAAALTPRLLKHLIAQERPDRRFIHGPRHGIPRSGEAYDAFPSGHAIYMGVLASAVSGMAPEAAPAAWSLAGLIAATRVMLLAHWTTDVLAGFAIGAGLERLLRLLRLPPRPRA
jgi:undecaprenyl-diphosphatase